MYDVLKQANCHFLLICFIKCHELQKQLSKNTFLYTRSIVLRQGRVTFLRFFNKSLLPVVLLEVKKSNPWQQIQLFKYKFVGPGGMLCNSNNVMKKDKSNYIIHGRKKHLKIFILPWSDWQMCVGDAAEILAHAGEQTAVIYCHIEKNNPAID